MSTCGSHHTSSGECCPGVLFRIVRPVQDSLKAFGGIRFEGLSLGKQALSSCAQIHRDPRTAEVEGLDLMSREEKRSKSHHGTQTKAQDSALQADMCRAHPRADHKLLSNLRVSLKPRIHDDALSPLW